MNQILNVQNLKKSYDDIIAVNNISFTVEEGSLFAFLGPNGAGKSTTIDMITTFLKPDEGHIQLDHMIVGKDDDRIRSCIGAVFQQSLLDNHLSVKENLMTRASLYGFHKHEIKEAVDHALTICELYDVSNRKYGKLSGGQRRRCDIARAFIMKPKILFLDEPTTGLDPQTRKMLWNVIKNLQKQTGMTVFLTTHYMEEAADANHIVVINQGEICAQGTPVQLKEAYANDTLRLYPKEDNDINNLLQQLSITFTKLEDRYEIALSHTMDAIPMINECKPYLKAFEVVHGTLDDAFLSIIGKRLQE